MLYRLGITYNILDENMEHDDIWIDLDIFIESDHPPTHRQAIKICEDNEDEKLHLNVLNSIGEHEFPHLARCMSSASHPVNVQVFGSQEEEFYIIRTIRCELIENVYKIAT